MRKKIAEILLKEAKKDKRIIFMTGDLGFNAFETLQYKLGKRFINAGVAEQNMVTLAGGLAYSGLKPWIFSIAPFVSVKVLEELRNDICFSNLDVKIIGSGGGYDYEIAGPSHHALEDVAVLSTLPNTKIYLPAVTNDIEDIVGRMNRETGLKYLRLVRARAEDIRLGKFSSCRHVAKGEALTILALGSILDKVWQASLKFKEKLVDLWVVGEMPFTPTKSLIESIKKTKKLIVIEEHVAVGGLGQYISTFILKNNVAIDKFVHLFAKGYISKRTGSRDFYLKETGLDAESIIKTVKQFI